MVGPDELDDDLEGEVTDECNVYGKVLVSRKKVKIIDIE